MLSTDVNGDKVTLFNTNTQRKDLDTRLYRPTYAYSHLDMNPSISKQNITMTTYHIQIRHMKINYQRRAFMILYKNMYRIIHSKCIHHLSYKLKLQQYPRNIQNPLTNHRAENTVSTIHVQYLRVKNKNPNMQKLT